MGDVFVTVLAYRKFFQFAWRASTLLGRELRGVGPPPSEAVRSPRPRPPAPAACRAGTAPQPLLVFEAGAGDPVELARRCPVLPPADDDPPPLAALPDPPLTTANSPLAVLPFSPSSGSPPPPRTTDQAPLALYEISSTDRRPVAAGRVELPAAHRRKAAANRVDEATTNPPKLEKLCPSPTTTLCEPVRMSGPPISRGSL